MINARFGRISLGFRNWKRFFFFSSAGTKVYNREHHFYRPPGNLT